MALVPAVPSWICALEIAVPSWSRKLVPALPTGVVAATELLPGLNLLPLLVTVFWVLSADAAPAPARAKPVAIAAVPPATATPDMILRPMVPLMRTSPFQQRCCCVGRSYH